MIRIILSVFCFIIFIFTSSAQYTNIINSNKPGDADTPYSVGINVLQIENSVILNNIVAQPIYIKTNNFSNDLNIHYGFLSEKLEATLNHVYTHGTFNNKDISDTQNLSIGLKYLIYEHKNKESVELKKSWKRRYGFKYNGLIPSVAVSFKYHTPFSNNEFYNGGLNTFSLAIITQNSINQKIRFNNQLGYLNHNGNYAQMLYTTSVSYVIAKRWNPYIQYQHYGSSDNIYDTFSIGTPFLVNKNLSISSHYKYIYDKDYVYHQAGINISYRLDNHKDKWKKIKKAKKAKKTKEEKHKYNKVIKQSDVRVLDLEAEDDTKDNNDKEDVILSY